MAAAPRLLARSDALLQSCSEVLLSRPPGIVSRSRRPYFSSRTHASIRVATDLSVSTVFSGYLPMAVSADRSAASAFCRTRSAMSAT